MTDLDSYVKHYLSELGGPRDSDAFHSLLETGPAALLLLESALHEVQSVERRATIINLIWQTRDPRAVNILGRCLQAPEPEVWREALDGLVTIGGSEAAQVLNAALVAVRHGAPGPDVEWLVEAVEQVGDQQ